MNESSDDMLIEVVETKLADDGTTTLNGTKVGDIKKKENGQNTDYVILSDAERARGFIRPVRRSYRHLTCGQKTSMPQKIAETYAARPDFYGATFCCTCGKHLPVGKDGEFVWIDEKTGVTTDEKVGT
jgi:hypothetical protein